METPNYYTISETTLQAAYFERQKLGENQKKDLRELISKGFKILYFNCFC